MRCFNHLHLAVISLVLAAFLAPVREAVARRPVSLDDNVSNLPTVALVQLPPQGQSVYRKILQGGPFEYDKDGVVFGNRERLLPANRRGYYHEYTVKTPGERSRGARRIICGGQEPQVPDACFYTEDHYSSFRKIVP
jgi:ribonuclease T1